MQHKSNYSLYISLNIKDINYLFILTKWTRKNEGEEEYTLLHPLSVPGTIYR